MIILNCSNCHAVLEMDEAFAGGVCRCRHCGAIQTVPVHHKHRNVAAAKKKQGRTLYSKRASREDAIPSSGLDQLAQVVASSGLSSDTLRGLRKKKPSRQKVFLIGLGAGAVLILIAVAITVSVMRARPISLPSANPVAASSAGGAETASAASLTGTPNFCGIALTDRSVIYVLDRGSGTSDSFSYLKEACFKSAASLGADRRFQIIFWNNGSEDAYPSSGPTLATAVNVEAARKALDGVYAHGQSDVGSALTKAVAANPDRILLVTAKGAQLGEEFIQQVLKIHQGHPTKIDTFDIGGSDSTAAMKTIAGRTGGGAYLLSEADLKRYGKD